MFTSSPSPVPPHRFRFGWDKDEPDERDLIWKDVKTSLMQLRQAYRRKRATDLRGYFPPVRNQGDHNSCTAFACLAVVEYFEHRLTGAICERSKAFLYAMMRSAHVSGTSDRFSTRDTVKTLVRYGTPPEVYWPYAAETINQTPADRQLFGYVGDFRTLRYARLDLPDARGRDALKKTRTCLLCGLPVVFGVQVHHSMSSSCPFPMQEPIYGGWQSVVACGHDDSKQCLLIRNSWGSDWGKKGYAWLPYEYVVSDHAVDFWIFLKDEWIARLAEQNQIR